MFIVRRLILALLVAVAGVVLLPLAGCGEPRVRVGNEELTAAQIESRAAAEAKAAEAKAAASLAAEAAKLESAKRDLARELARLKASNEVATVELQAEYDDRTGAILAAMQAVSARAAAEIEASKAKWDEARAAVEAEAAKRLALAGTLDTLGQAAGGLPIPGSGLLAGALGLGAWLLRGHVHRRVDREWTEAQADQLRQLLALGGGSIAALLQRPTPTLPPAPAPTTPPATPSAGGAS